MIKNIITKIAIIKDQYKHSNKGANNMSEYSEEEKITFRLENFKRIAFELGLTGCAIQRWSEKNYDVSLEDITCEHR